MKIKVNFSKTGAHAPVSDESLLLNRFVHAKFCKFSINSGVPTRPSHEPINPEPVQMERCVDKKKCIIKNNSKISETFFKNPRRELCIDRWPYPA
jgi:hypothetical protein